MPMPLILNSCVSDSAPALSNNRQAYPREFGVLPGCFFINRGQASLSYLLLGAAFGHENKWKFDDWPPF